MTKYSGLKNNARNLDQSSSDVRINNVLTINEKKNNLLLVGLSPDTQAK